MKGIETHLERMEVIRKAQDCINEQIHRSASWWNKAGLAAAQEKNWGIAEIAFKNASKSADNPEERRRFDHLSECCGQRI